jgi:hypothetical protein
MLKTLLAERFKLVVRERSVSTTAMALKVKGHTQAQGVFDWWRGLSGSGRSGTKWGRRNHGDVQHDDAQFVEQLPQNQSAYFPNGQKLIDETGLSGSWDFQLKFTPRPLLGQAGSDGITLQAALEKVGLFMEPKESRYRRSSSRPRTPEFTNPADLAKRLPPAPSPQFEVAVLKPTAPEVTQTRGQLRPTGQVDLSAAPLNRLIGLAWSLTDGVPGWRRCVPRRSQVAGDGTLRRLPRARSPTRIRRTTPRPTRTSCG